MDVKTQDEQLVSRREAAHLADVHVNTIRLWEQHGRLHARKAENGRVLIPLSELEGIVRERRLGEGDSERRLIEAETRAQVLAAENELLRQALEQLRREHEELLQTVIEVARGKE